jgi:hypothetical protein
MSACQQNGCDEVQAIREGIAGLQTSMNQVLVELHKRPRTKDDWYEPTDIRIERGKNRRNRPIAWLGLLVALLAVVPAWYAMLRGPADAPAAGSGYRSRNDSSGQDRQALPSAGPSGQDRQAP